MVAIGDIHGDFDAFLGLLTHVGLIDGERRWNGRDITLVQTGDYMDRGPKVRPLLDFLMTLEAQAAAGGGRAIVLMGNHEASNAIGVLRDVPASAFAAFADAESEGRREAAYAAHVKLAEARRAALARADAAIPIPKVYMIPERDAWMAAHPPGLVEYLEAFGPNGTYGKWIRTRMVLVRINDTVFLHGGINPEVAPKKLESLNEQAQKEIARWDRMRKQMIEQQIALPSFTFEELLEAGGSELTRVGLEARRRLDMNGQADPAARGAGHLVAPARGPAGSRQVGHPRPERPALVSWIRNVAFGGRGTAAGPAAAPLRSRAVRGGSHDDQRFPRDGPILVARVPHRYRHAVVLLPGRPCLGARHPERDVHSRDAGGPPRAVRTDVVGGAVGGDGAARVLRAAARRPLS